MKPETPSDIVRDMLRLRDSAAELNGGREDERRLAKTVEAKLAAKRHDLAGLVWFEANQPRTPVEDVVHMEGWSA